MIILCPICSDTLINPSEDINMTLCGHLFHQKCICTWIDRSKSCPQCRQRITQKSILRVFPTTTDAGTTGDDNAASLQIQLDHKILTLTQKETELEKHTKEISRISKALETSEKKLAKNEIELAVHKEQLQYLKIENQQLKKVQDELESHKKNLQVLQGLQKVFSATVEEVEQMLEGYPDVRTVATFATALKKALYESETKKTELRENLQAAKQKLGIAKKQYEDLQSIYMQLEENFATLTKKFEEKCKTITEQNRTNNKLNDNLSLFEDSWCLTESKAPRPKHEANFGHVTDTTNTSLNTLINKIENADSPYLKLKQSSLAETLAWDMLQPSTSEKAMAAPKMNEKENGELQYLNLKQSSLACSLQRPSTSKKETELSPIPMPTDGKLRQRKLYSKSDHDEELSIFQFKEPVFMDISNEKHSSKSELNKSYDGLGGHAPISETLPKPKTKIPKVTIKHRLKRPNSCGTPSILEVLKKSRDK